MPFEKPQTPEARSEPPSTSDPIKKPLNRPKSLNLKIGVFPS